VNDLRWSTEDQRAIVEVNVFTEDDEVFYSPHSQICVSFAVADRIQKGVRLRDDAISAKHTSAAEDSRRQETSLAQQDFAMGYVTGRILEGRIDIGFFKIGEILQNLFRRHAAGKDFKHMAHGNPHAANRRFTTANVWFDRNTFDVHNANFIKT
jgi:hypothetical protein